VIAGEQCVNPAQVGTKACLHYKLNVPAGGSVVVSLRLSDQQLANPLKDVEKIVKQRRKEADEFYAAIQPPQATEDERRVQRQAFAGMLWSKQIYLYDVERWFTGDNPRSEEHTSELQSQSNLVCRL